MYHANLSRCSTLWNSIGDTIWKYIFNIFAVGKKIQKILFFIVSMHSHPYLFYHAKCFHIESTVYMCKYKLYSYHIILYRNVFVYLPSNNLLLNKASCNVVILIRVREERDLSNFSDFKLLIFVICSYVIEWKK